MAHQISSSRLFASEMRATFLAEGTRPLASVGAHHHRAGLFHFKTEGIRPRQGVRFQGSALDRLLGQRRLATNIIGIVLRACLQLSKWYHL